MTWDRFDRYVKSMLGGAFCAYVVVDIVLVEWILGKGQLILVHGNTQPLAIVTLLLGALWGWSLVFKDPDPQLAPKPSMVDCPCCGSRVREDALTQVAISMNGVD